jgi:hypothetical protein
MKAVMAMVGEDEQGDEVEQGEDGGYGGGQTAR